MTFFTRSSARSSSSSAWVGSGCASFAAATRPVRDTRPPNPTTIPATVLNHSRRMTGFEGAGLPMDPSLVESALKGRADMSAFLDDSLRDGLNLPPTL